VKVVKEIRDSGKAKGRSRDCRKWWPFGQLVEELPAELKTASRIQRVDDYEQTRHS
jgi:hypothetical protein